MLAGGKGQDIKTSILTKEHATSKGSGEHRLWATYLTEARPSLGSSLYSGLPLLLNPHEPEYK